MWPVKLYGVRLYGGRGSCRGECFPCRAFHPQLGWRDGKWGNVPHQGTCLWVGEVQASRGKRPALSCPVIHVRLAHGGRRFISSVGILVQGPVVKPHTNRRCYKDEYITRGKDERGQRKSGLSLEQRQTKARQLYAICRYD